MQNSLHIHTLRFLAIHRWERFLLAVTCKSVAWTNTVAVRCLALAHNPFPQSREDSERASEMRPSDPVCTSRVQNEKVNLRKLSITLTGYCLYKMLVE